MLSGNTYTPLASVADSTNTADNNLRSAIAAANADTGALTDTIDLSAGTYTLGVGAGLGQLKITNTSHTLIIDGKGSSGPNATIISQTAIDRVFEVSGARVIFENVEITGGTAETDDTGATTGQVEGGGILDEGNVTLDNVAVIGNEALGQGDDGQNAVGGGVFSTGVLNIADGSLIANNSAIASNDVSASPTSADFFGNAEGGGVFSNTETDLQITDSTVEDNIAQGGTGSAPGVEPGLALGGGVYIFNATGAETSQLTGDTISGNQAIAGAAAAGVAGGGDGGEGGFAIGGGVDVDFQAAAGTAAAVGGPVVISNSTISGNISQGGAGGAAGSGGGGTVGDGGVGVGGGINSNAPGSDFLNDTIYGNTAVGGAGNTIVTSGIPNPDGAFGGGLDDESTAVYIASVTVTANSAQAGAPSAGATAGTAFGGGIDNDGNADTSLTLQNSLVAANTAPNGPDFLGAAVSTDDNLIGDGTGSSGFSASNGDQVGTTISPINAKLGPFQNNGGSTDTVALLAGSPALGAGDPAVATATDQRGLPRVVAGETDIGAFETQLQTPTVTNATTSINTQTTSGLVITPSGADAAVVTNFQITGITGGTLFQSNGTTPITDGEFITVAQGAAGLKFTPTTGSTATGSFTIQGSTDAGPSGLSGTTATATIAVTIHSPTVTGTSTTENTQTSSGLLITPNAIDTSVTNFQITGISGGTLFLNNGTTQITNGEFITVAQGAAGLKFTPTTGSLATGSFTVQESTSASAGGLSGTTATATISVSFNGPAVTGATTAENTQTTSGLIVTPGASDTATSFQVTGITGGTLFLNNGTTAISNGSFITVAQGAAGLKFTPTTGSIANGSFTVRESSNGAATGLSGPTATASVVVSFKGPAVTSAATTENTQTTAGLVITPGASDTATSFQITGITGGTLFQHDGTTAIASGSFIAAAQGAAGLKFTPTSGSFATGTFTVRESSDGTATGLSGPTAAATITVSSTGIAAPTVTSSATTENTQTTSGLVITPSSGATTNFQITNITGGTLFQHDGTTQITSGAFITLAQGEAGLKFTPTTGSLTTGGFAAQEATGSSAGDLTGSTATASIFVVSAAATLPTVTPTTTTENTQTTSGLVITPSSASTTFFQITNITGGTLFQNNGTTQITSGAFITLAQGEAGLKFTPTSGSLATGSFAVQEATGSSAGNLTGSAATATIFVVSAAATVPTVTPTTTTENTQTTSGLVITPSSASTTFFQITGITGGTLFQNNGTTQITSGSFITLAQGEAGLKFTPTTGSTATGGFGVQEATGNSAADLTGSVGTATIFVSAAASAPTVTPATTTENTQTTSGLVIASNSGGVTNFQITAITGGTLYQNDGTTQIASGSFITLAQGEAGLKFTPTTGSTANGSFTVQGATGASASNLTGSTATATITVGPGAPTLTNAATTENTQTTSGLVLTPSSASTTNFQITGITGGTLYQNDGTTQIASGSFITLAQGEAGLKFTPTTGSTANGSFIVQQSTSSSSTGLIGPTASATIHVNGTEVVDLSTYYNVTGITTDGTKFGAGIDGQGNALSETEVGSSIAWNGLTFGLGSPNVNNVVQGTGQTITLSSGSYTKVELLAVGTNGSQPGQQFTLNYSDGTSTTVTQSISDWAMAQGYAGESVALTSVYRNTSAGGANDGTFDVYGYSIAVDSTKTLQSITLPNDAKVKILSIVTLTSVDAPTSLTATDASTTQVNLSWTASDSTVTGYNVYRSTTSGGESTTPLNSSPLSPTATSYQDTSVLAGNTYYYTVKGVNGPATSSASNEAHVTVSTTVATTEVDLAGLYNLTGITVDGATFGGGFDGQGNALSETQVGTSQTWNGATFAIAPAGSSNVIQAAGQTLDLPSGSYSQVELLAAGVNGNQPDQTFTVNYTDGTSTTITQSISDWHMPQSYSGESIVLSTPYRNTSTGRTDDRGPFDIYGYSFAVNSAKTVASITLPDNSNVDVLSISMVGSVAAPTNLTVTDPTSSSANLSWTAASGTITGYNVYRGTTAGGEATTPINSSPLAATATSYSDTTAVAGNTYYYVVKAINTPAVSAASNEVHATTTNSATTTEVDLTGEYNQTGITADGSTFSGGLDGKGNALSATLLGTSQTWNGAAFNIAPAGSSNVIQAAGQTIGLPNKSFSQVELLATGVNGNQPPQTFTVNYTDGTSTAFARGISDWATPQSNSGESVAVSMAYRNTSSGGKDNSTFNVYGYTLAVDNTKTIASITLPDDKNVEIVAITAAT
jgi:hypothetical protein